MPSITGPGAAHRVPQPVSFDVADIALWQIDLDQYDLQDVEEICSVGEHERARRFARPILRRRYLAARHALRCLLGSQLRCSPSSLVIDRDAFGKPQLRAADPGSQMYFNVSHSEHLALIGLRSAGPIGVDVEIVRSMSDEADLALRHFTEAEQRAWAEAGTTDAFFLCWTRKEACLKALGVGLAVDTRMFGVDVTPARSSTVVPLSGDTDPCIVEVESVQYNAGTGVFAPAAVAWTDVRSTQRARSACGR